MLLATTTRIFLSNHSFILVKHGFTKKQISLVISWCLLSAKIQGLCLDSRLWEVIAYKKWSHMKVQLTEQRQHGYNVLRESILQRNDKHISVGRFEKQGFEVQQWRLIPLNYHQCIINSSQKSPSSRSLSYQLVSSTCKCK